MASAQGSRPAGCRTEEGREAGWVRLKSDPRRRRWNIANHRGLFRHTANAEIAMSDPRYTGSGYTGPRNPRSDDPLEPRRRMSDGGSGQMWTWVAAIVAIAVVIALVAGYYRSEPTSASRTSSPPTTTGAAPSVPPPSPPAANPSPATPAPATPTPASPGAPAPAPGGAPHP
jgi:hypothetical protein